MNPIYILGAIAIAAYILQMFLGMRQIKNFNLEYARLRKIGRVAIGKQSGRIQAGTLMLFALDPTGIILECMVMQGVSVIARFKKCEEFVGIPIQELHEKHPVFVKKNKLIIRTALNAKDVYARITNGEKIEENKNSLLNQLKFKTNLWTFKIKQLWKRSA